MSIASDLRSYADNAVNQGKHALDSAQAQLNDVTGNATELYGKAADAVSDLRAQAEKAVNLDAIKTAVEPYLQQARGYVQTAGDRAEVLLGTVKSDKRVAQLVDVAGAVVETVQQRVVQPVQALTRRETKPAPVAKPAPKATTRPASKPAATKPATKATARKAAAKRTTTKS
jgi:hypothetical protein